MGLFNFFNYSKEGPGVSKAEPKKKAFFRFFELYFRNFWKLCTMNLYYVLLSIPVLTYGLGEVGLANVTRNVSREKHSFGAQDFFETVKKNWKQGLLLGILNLLVSALLIFDVWYFYNTDGTMATVFLGITLFLLFTVTVMRYYVPFMTVTFSLKTKQLLKNSFKFVFLNLPKNLIIFFSNLAFCAAMVAAVIFCGQIGAAITMLLLVFIYPSFRAFLIQFTIFDCIKKYMIDPYYAEHPEADIQKRLDLGLDVPEEYMPRYDEDIVFDDERILPETKENL